MKSLTPHLIILITIFISGFSFAQKPELFWGYNKGSFTINPDEKVLAVQTETYDGGYTILDWKVTIDGLSKKGKGSYLNKEISPWIQQFRKDSVYILLEVTYIKVATHKKGKIKQDFFFSNPIYPEDLTKPYVGFILIDKNAENNRNLFDAGNPESLLGIILKNPLPSPAFMSDETFNDIRKQNSKTPFIYSKGFQSDAPFVSEKLDEQGRIVDSIKRVDEGYYSFIYPAPKEYAYDLTEITRLVLFLDTVENPSTQEKYMGISRIGLAKKYPNSNKYDIVLTFSYHEFIEMNHFHILVEADSLMTQKLTNKDSYFQTEFKDTCIKTTFEKLISEGRNHVYFPYFSSLPDRTQERKSEVIAHLYEEVSTFNLNNSLAYGQNVGLYFDSVNYILGPESDIPFTNEYGEDSLVNNSDGTIVFVYPPRDTIITWVETDSIHVYVQYELERNDLLHSSFVAKSIYFTNRFGTKTIPFLEFYLEKNNSEIRSNYSNLEIANLAYFQKEFQLSNLRCTQQIAKTVNDSPRILKSENKKDLTYLFSEFNLEKKGNLLNVQMK